MKNRILSTMTTLLLTSAILLPGNAALAASSEASTEAASTESSVAVASDGAVLPTEDPAGNKITVPAEVNTIIAMSPSSTRLLIDLGLADKIIACDTYSYQFYGDSLKKDLPQFDMMTPDNESIVALKPDIIFTTGMSYSSGEDVYAAVRQSGICIADIPSASSLADIEDSISFIGACTKASEEAAEITADMSDTIDSLKKLGESIPEDQRKTVLYMSNTPTADYPSIYSAGKGTYINEMIQSIGAVNAAGDEDGWASFTEEAAVALDPEVILTTDTYTENVVDTILSLDGWENVKAVKDKNVYLMTYSNELNQPNQHVVSAMVEMAKDVYPETFADAVDPFADDNMQTSETEAAEDSASETAGTEYAAAGAETEN